MALDDRMILHTGGLVFIDAVSSVYLIDTVSGDITPRKNMKTKRYEHRVVLLGSEAIAIAGWTLKSAERYSLQDDQWTDLADLNVKRSSFAASSIKDKYIYVFAGLNDEDSRLDSIEQYDALSNKWTELSIKYPVS